jgi:uracil-DNA glycosylase
MAEEDEETKIVMVPSIYDYKENMSYSVPFSVFFQKIGYPSGWEDFFEQQTQELDNISLFLQQASKSSVIYPAFNEVFRIYYDIPPDKVKVIILGQDPYPNGSAVGYAFSVKEGRQLNSSLVNIKKELETEEFTVQKKSGDLSNWVKQGVFLLNTALTVEQNHVGSHTKLWDKFTRSSLKYLTRIKKNLPIMLWGKMAQDFISSVSCKDTHHFIMTSHPSGLSAYRGGNSFFNSNCFNRANEFLSKVGDEHIDFNIP